MVKSGISPEYFHKYNRVDLLTETESGELVLIELQVGGQYDYFHRMLYGSSKLITDHMDRIAEVNVKLKRRLAELYLA